MLSILQFNREDIAEHRASVASLVAVNLLPLVGVVAFDWSAFDVVFLYWIENVVIGAVNLLKILTCWPDPKELGDSLREKLAARIGAAADEETASEAAKQSAQLTEWIDNHSTGSQTAMQASKLFFAPFFTVHYGIFCLVHGVFVCVLLGGGLGGGGMNGPLDGPLEALGSVSTNPGFLLAVLGLVASHLVSYFTNFLGGGEYRRTMPPLLMMQPYARIVVLHIAIVLSGFFVVALGQPIALLVLLVVGKTLLDLGLHLREHSGDVNEDDASDDDANYPTASGEETTVV